jgi:hypothetical protein
MAKRNSLSKTTRPESRREPRPPLRGADPGDWGTWLNGFAWSFFVTLTTEGDFSLTALERATERFTKRIGAQAWFRAIEGGDVERRHVHLLLYVDAATSIEDVKGTWSHGRVDTTRYDHARGAAWYTCKRIRKTDYYDVSTALPPRVELCVGDERSDSSLAEDTGVTLSEETMTEDVFRTIRVAVATDLEPIDLAAWARRYARAVIAAHRNSTSSEAA